MSTEEGMKGKEKFPENIKVKKYRMRDYLAKIDKLREHYNTVKNRYDDNERKIVELERENKYLKEQINKLKSLKEENIKKLEELEKMTIPVEDLETLRKEKAKLEKEIEELKNNLSQMTEKVDTALDEISID